MGKGRFLNQKLGKRTSRKMKLLKAKIRNPDRRLSAGKTRDIRRGK